MVYKCLSKFWMYILSYMAIIIPVTLYLATIEFNVFVFVIWIMVTVCMLIFALGNYMDSKIISSENLPGTVYKYLDSKTLANVRCMLLNAKIDHKLEYGFLSSTFFPNEPLIIWTFFGHFCHHFWLVLAGWWIGVAVPLYPPKRDDKNGQEMFNWSEVYLEKKYYL